MKWKSLKSDSIDYIEIQRQDKDVSQGVCSTHTPDCGTVRNNKNCQCGEHKDSHHSLCTSCHSILPEDLQKDVDWCPEVYQAAIQYLND